MPTVTTAVRSTATSHLRGGKIFVATGFNKWGMTNVVADETCALSAMCSHLGGIVTWNDQKTSPDKYNGSKWA